MADGKIEKNDSSDGSDHLPERKESIAPGVSIGKRQDVFDVDTEDIHQLNAVFENPLASIEPEQLLQDVEEFCAEWGLNDHLEVMKKGALVARDPHSGPELEGLTSEEREALINEKEHKWRHPFMLYWLVIMCSLGAATQGMDESVNNGAVSIYTKTLGINNVGSKQKVDNIQGLVVSAPYLACAVLGCWITEPLNKVLGRRGTIFVSCFIAAVASIWEGVVQSWPNLFAARFVLGLGIGAKSTTVPVYCAECAPAPIRGALVMQWQVWTAFGIMVGNIMGVAFGGLGPDLSWRLMLGSTVVLPTIVLAQVYFCPESPRWLIQKDKLPKAYRSFRRIRNTDLQAARDLYYTYVGVQLEKQVTKGKNLFTQFYELFSVPRNRRATLATWIVMFGQQFCGKLGQPYCANPQ